MYLWVNSGSLGQIMPIGALGSSVPALERRMKKSGWEIMVAVVLSLSCVLSTSVLAESKSEKQEDIQKVAQQTLEQLYQAQPLAKAAVEKAAGYAVFSDMGFKLLFAGSGAGQGVVVNNKTKQKTYMKMVEVQAGLGLGVSKFRNVFVFKTRAAMDRSSIRDGSLAGRRRPARKRRTAVGRCKARWRWTKTSGCTS